MIKFKKEKKKDFVCDGCGKGYIGATRNSLVIRVAGYETYNIPLCNACLLSLKKKINKTEKKVSDENMLKTVEEALMKNELCLFMGETGTFMTTGTQDDAEEIFLKLQSVLLAGFLSMEKATDYDIEQILLLQLEAVKKIKKELPGVTPPKGSILLKGESVLN